MSSDNSDNQYDSDMDEVNPKQHKRLIKDVLNLNKKQYVSKPSRTEPALQVSEFNLINSTSTNNAIIRLNDLTKVLKKRANLGKIDKKISKVDTKTKTLAKPLDKVHADRIRRTVGYEKTRLDLDKWDAVVTAHRGAEHMKFPLQTDIELKQDEQPHFTFRVKSDLQKELEEILPKVEEYRIDLEERVPLTMKEMIEKRREAAKLRAHMSFKEAKARRQNKIKSKKYHRIQRREKIKKQLQEFEMLQKTNPEAALEKLEEIERARAEERMSLRHKGTGKWAKSKQIRAKYDKDSRKVLAQQLTISKELTQKVKANDSSDSENESMIIEQTAVSKNNPWVKNSKTDNEIDSFLSGYRKFWENQNKQEKTLEKQNAKDEIEEQPKPGLLNAKVEETISNLPKVQRKQPTPNKLKSASAKENNGSNINKLNKVIEVATVGLEEPKLSNAKVKTTDMQKVQRKRPKSEPIKNQTTRPKRKKISIKESEISTEINSTSEWDVSLVNDEIQKAFDAFESKLAHKLKVKYGNLKKKLNLKNKLEKKKLNKIKTTKKIDLSITKKTKKPIIDEKLTNNEDTEEKNEVNNLKAILSSKNDEEENFKKKNKPKPETEIKIVQLNTKIPDLLITDDNEDDLAQREVIAGAFEDEDIVEDFNKEKQDDINKNKPKDIDLNLPGWGCWGGKNVPLLKRKRKRFIIRTPKVIPRRDDNKGNVIVYEGGNKDVKSHLVSDLPFPFKTVKDYEASIRAPIGNTFVPEIAFRKLTLPAVKTKMGAIIEPLSEDILLKKKYSV